MFAQKNRKKIISLKIILNLLLGTLILIFIILGSSTFYSTWLGFKRPNASIIWFPSPIDLWKRGINPAIQQIYFGSLNVLFAKDVPETSTIPTIKILLPDNTFDRFNHEIFLYGLNYNKKKPYSKAFAKTENETSFLSAKAKMRGVHNDHHQIWKPSLRISYKKNAFPEGFKNHVLIAPRDGIGFQNWITDQLAQKWGLVTPNEHFVRMFINKKYFGLYTRVWRLDESLLINTGRLPSPFFRMEYLIDRKYRRFYGHWKDPQTWAYKGIEKHEGMNLMRRVVDSSLLLDQPKTIFENPTKTRADLINYSNKLNGLIDRDSFAKFLSILCYAGETHIDDIHNNAFLMDPGTGKLAPILIDTGGMSFEFNRHLNRPITKKRGAFIYPWLLNPINFSIYIDHLYEFLHTLGSPKNASSLILNAWNEIKPHAFADVLASKSGCSGRCFVGTTRLEKIVSELIDFITQRTHWIEEQLLSDKLVLTKQQENGFEVYIEGFSGMEIRRKDGKHFLIKGSNIFRPHFTLLPSMPLNLQQFVNFPLPEAYAFYNIPGRPEDYVFTHRLTNRQLNFTTLERGFKALRTVQGLDALSFSEPKIEPVQMGPGTVLIEKTIVFNKNQAVNIRSGTKILLGKNVSLIVQGPLKINGSASQPVIIRPIKQEEPFGVLAVLGKETNGSEIRYLDIEGGSIARHFNLNLTGMFSVHDSPNIKIANSRFGQNFIGDDAVHFLRSKVKFTDSVLENALNDAMDLDLVDGEISDSVFRNSGNDGLDISMGTVLVTNSHFEKSGDKCISAGEGTKTIVNNSKFYKCKIGIAVKDRSRVELTNNLFTENDIAYNTYRKKWRWEKGGEGIIRNTLFMDSIKKDIKGDKHSKVTFIGPTPINIRMEGKFQLTSISK
jgi:hypothetical protein